MTHQRLITAILVGSLSLLLMGGTVSAIIITGDRPDASAADLVLFQNVKDYLEREFKACGQCKFMIIIQNGHVAISGVAPKGSLPHLRKLSKAVREIKSLNLDKVKFSP